MITAKICLFLTADAKRRFSFISESIIEQWNHDGSVPTQREIAEKYGRKESSISRTFKDFLEKIKREG